MRIKLLFWVLVNYKMIREIKCVYCSIFDFNLEILNKGYVGEF